MRRVCFKESPPGLTKGSSVAREVSVKISEPVSPGGAADACIHGEEAKPIFRRAE